MKSVQLRKQKPIETIVADERLISTLAQLHSAQGELASTQLILDVLSQFTILMSKNLDFEHFCQAVSRILKKRLKFTYIHIWVFNGKDELTLLTPEKKGARRSTTIAQGIMGKTIRTQKKIFVEDVSKDPDYVKAHRDTTSELCIPLLFEDALLGVMNIETKKNEPLKEFIPLLEVIAENLGYALRIAFLHGVEDQFKKLLEQMNEGLCVIDNEGLITYANRALLAISGYNPDEILNKSYKHFFRNGKNSSEKINVSNYKALNTFLINKNKDEIPTLLTTNTDADGNTVATITDLRLLKSTEEKLEETEVLLTSITQTAHEAILALDQQGIVRSWNVGAQRLFGYKESEIQGRSLDFILHMESPHHISINSIIDEAQMKHYVKHVELLCAHKNGMPVDVALTANALFNGNGSLMGFAIFLRDISAQKKWEHEIQDRFEKIQEAYREMGKQRRYLDYLTELIQYANTPGINKKNIATFIVNALIMITKVNAATVRLYEKEDDRLCLIAYSGLSDDWVSKKYVPYRGSLVETAIEQKCPLKIFDIVSNSQYYSPALARKNNLRSALVIPLTCQGEILGSVSLYLSHEGNLNLLDDDFISIFAGQASLALKLAGD